MSAPPMFSTTPPPTLPAQELPPSPVDLSGVANPNLPDVEPAVQENWNDTKVEETALELMREAFESSSSASQPSSSSDASPSTTHPTSSSSHHQTTTFLNRPPQPVTPPRRFSTLSSVDTRDPSARTSQNEAKDRLERDLNGQGRARRMMNEPEGKGDDVEGDKSWNGGGRKEVLSWRVDERGNSAGGRDGGGS